MVRKVVGPDAGTIYAMKVLKKATLKGMSITLLIYYNNISCFLQRQNLINPLSPAVANLRQQCTHA